MTPEQVLDVQLRVREVWLSKVKALGKLRPDSKVPVDGSSATVADGLEIASHQASLLGMAETYFVADRIVSVLETAAKELPSPVFAPASLPPHPFGFAYFSEPIVEEFDAPEIWGEGPLSIRAVSWDSRIVLSEVEAIPKNDSLAGLVAGMREKNILALGPDAEPPDGFRTKTGILMSVYADGKTPGSLVCVDFHLLEPTEPLFQDPTFTVSRFMVALWSFAHQKIVTADRVKAGRPFLKRAARAGVKTEGITVIDLRARYTTPSLKDPELDASEAPFSPLRFRVPVRAHWRRQFYPSLGPARHGDLTFNEESHRWIFIDECFRGPEWAPIVQRDRLFKVRR